MYKKKQQHTSVFYSRKQVEISVWQSGKNARFLVMKWFVLNNPMLMGI